MNRREAFLKIKSVAADGGFTFLDVMSVFQGVESNTVQGYLQKAYELDYISMKPENRLCMYPTQKLRDMK